jgi:hypothetical protein
MSDRDGLKALIPTLPAYRDADGIHYLVWCKFCRRYHHHRGPITAALRLAHCPTDSLTPYSATGYKLQDAGPASRSMIRRAGRQPLQPEGRSEAR